MNDLTQGHMNTRTNDHHLSKHLTCQFDKLTELPNRNKLIINLTQGPMNTRIKPEPKPSKHLTHQPIYN